ncbi:hypothetical protein BT63DRAFT_286376 [Microthyrium microscopicum]|uniref:PPP4R2-domain-containing protein n=1 Tax=Microthyrium microscopicum TaxID=703497 RepID=A0A6A6UD30_9PEZI|nr:hypothetical protein BT63DRAFT_286376 [Microthyrium microscopicum]
MEAVASCGSFTARAMFLSTRRQPFSSLRNIPQIFKAAPYFARAMQSVEEILEQAAGGGSIQSDDWSRVRDFILNRIETLVSDEFPSPPSSLTSPPQPPAQAISSSETDLNSSPTITRSSRVTPTQELESTDKENAPPQVTSNATLDFFGQAQSKPSPLDIAKGLQADIRDSLSRGFPTYPPHTIQRLSELILWPKREYRYLPAYLQALNRVVSVTSNTSIFPLPHHTAPQSATAGLLVNGNIDSALGSDESLGGALLTPIPWLTANSPSTDADRDLQDTAQRLHDQHAIDTPSSSDTVMSNGEITPESSTDEPGSPSSVEAALRAEGAVTQDGHAPPTTTAAAEESEEIPHARGPEEIGVEDMGPQSGAPGGVEGILREHQAHEPTQGQTAEQESDTGMDVDTKAEETAKEADTS